METRLALRVEVKMRSTVKIEDNPDQSVTLGQGNFFEASAFDISMRGLGLVTKYFLPKGTSVELSMDGAPFKLEGPVKIHGEVSYCKSLSLHKYRCGVKFIDLTKEHQKAIKELIASYEKRREPRLPLSE